MTTSSAGYAGESPEPRPESIDEQVKRKGIRPFESVSWGPRTREQLEQWLGRFVVLDWDDATSRAWGRISAAARRRGRPRPANDSWIAA